MPELGVTILTTVAIIIVAYFLIQAILQLALSIVSYKTIKELNTNGEDPRSLELEQRVKEAVKNARDRRDQTRKKF